jgi:hypothetical protein
MAAFSNLITTLLVTILIEGVVVLAYCIWRRKPLLSIFVTSLAANIITQWLLWRVLQIFFRNYLAALLISELFIWFFESILLCLPRTNQLSYRSAVLLSFSMNLLSFGAGWFLSV